MSEEQNNNDKVHKHSSTLVLVVVLIIVAFIAVAGVASVKTGHEASHSANATLQETQPDTDNTQSDMHISQENVTENLGKEETEAQTLYTDVFTVCIDPGHGGKDSGTSTGSVYESEQVLELSLMLRDYLQEQQVRVIMTRASDVFVSLEDRAVFANANEADVIISIHRNYYPGWQRIHGIEAWIHSNEPSKAVTLANAVLDRLSGVDGTNIRGLKVGTSDDPDDNYKINRYTSMTSMILEMGYMSDATDNKLFEKNKEEYAAAIGQGILDYMEFYNLGD